jgi:transcription elongation factor GreA
VLTKVKLKNRCQWRYDGIQLVAEKEADIRKSKISVSSPIGKGLLGKKVGETAEIQVPRGVMSFEILEITRMA